MTKHHKISLSTAGQGLYEFTAKIQSLVGQETVKNGLCHLFIQHTSCSLIIQENADPSAKADLEAWMNRLVPENDPLYTHTFEGAGDMPAHIKSIVTATHLSIPVIEGQLALGTWQGVYLWEHRHAAHHRKIIMTLSD
ncbi:secondary thiamine-phosphate synthase enzyme YjbQ [Kangiella sp. TOML190]|uniref:secondary thiamine-phosphate synthase enzyme YjbQ n=1 Tax=Kangiella sp. TOML190 TaxID=2931351 RepID=UPI00203DA5B7|nr:secondary thiamine-phosphate synthase enzyme YjbQ [Kangiella sp. TOML190]